MKCLRCNAETESNGECLKCGLIPEEFKNEIEVAYKDFKTLELLEIRRKIHSESLEAESEKDLSLGRYPLVSNKSFSILIIAAAALVFALGGFFLFRALQ
jgi:hypothetical protein